MAYTLNMLDQEYSYKLGLYLGYYNSPRQQEDLAPRSRNERTWDIRNGQGPHIPEWLLYRNGMPT